MNLSIGVRAMESNFVLGIAGDAVGCIDHNGAIAAKLVVSGSFGYSAPEAIQFCSNEISAGGSLPVGGIFPDATMRISLLCWGFSSTIALARVAADFEERSR